MCWGNMSQTVTYIWTTWGLIKMQVLMQHSGVAQISVFQTTLQVVPVVKNHTLNSQGLGSDWRLTPAACCERWELLPRELPSVFLENWHTEYVTVWWEFSRGCTLTVTATTLALWWDNRVLLWCNIQFPYCVHKSVLYEYISTAALQIGSPVPFFYISYTCLKILFMSKSSLYFPLRVL